MSESKYINTKVNYLTIVSVSRRGQRQYAGCVCDCGKRKDIILYNVVKGHTKSCGCKKAELISVGAKKPRTHGFGSTRIYTTWHSMINRCTNIKCAAFKDYGGRGISVCEEWANVSAFVNWANKNGYSDTLTIDRIDVNGNYKPANCRWANKEVQSNNRRDNVYIKYNGENLTLTQWSRRLGGKPNLVRQRILFNGWDEIKAITTPLVDKQYKITDEQVREIYHLKSLGQMQTLELSKKYGVSEDTIRCIMRGKKKKISIFMKLKDLQSSWVDEPQYHANIHNKFIELVNANEQLKTSRDYIESNIWGFGERSFWWLWKLICDDLPEKPKMLEIGIFRGATISLWKLLRPEATVFGITPLDSTGGHWESDYEVDIKKIHDDFNLEQPKIYKGLSTDRLTKVWAGMEFRHGLSLLYVDGAHDYTSALSDLTWYSQFISIGGYLVIDDCNNDMNQPFGFFTGIADVTKAKVDWLATNPPFVFCCSVVHISVFKRV